jgi:hypothetical protein
MFTKSFAGLGLAALLASAPAQADSCYQSTRVYGDGNQVINNCTVVRDLPTRQPPPPPPGKAPIGKAPTIITKG